MSKNSKYHTDGFNSLANNIAFSNICEHVPELKANKEECEKFNKGILIKGTYTTTIKYYYYLIRYWDDLEKLYKDFLESNRTLYDQMRIFKDESLIMSDLMQKVYYNISMKLIVEYFVSDIKNL